MATSFGALCNDFYVNHKVALKMDLPSDRETVLHLFDRVRKTVPAMDRFRRYEGELVLESSRREIEYHWMSLRRTSIRTGHVNPQTMEEAYSFHQMVTEVAPFHLSISPLDVDHVELVFGFDLECKADHDQVVLEALYRDTPMENLVRVDGGKVLDVQPLFGISLNKKGDRQAYFEVKTRAKSRRGRSRFKDEPIGVFLSLRQFGPISELDDLLAISKSLAADAERLATDKLIPDLLNPIARQITSSSA